MFRIEVIIILLVINYVIASFLGKKRQIGFSWSFFFCFFLSPLLGFFVTILSRKNDKPNPEPSKAKKIWGWILISICTLSLIGQIMNIITKMADTSTFSGLFLAIGFIGLGYYLIELSAGKNFNTDSSNFSKKI